jgi:hypothetical protein
MLEKSRENARKAGLDATVADAVTSLQIFASK